MVADAGDVNPVPEPTARASSGPVPLPASPLPWTCSSPNSRDECHVLADMPSDALGATVSVVASPHLAADAAYIVAAANAFPGLVSALRSLLWAAENPGDPPTTARMREEARAALRTAGMGA